MSDQDDLSNFNSYVLRTYMSWSQANRFSSYGNKTEILPLSNIIRS